MPNWQKCIKHLNGSIMNSYFLNLLLFVFTFTKSVSALNYEHVEELYQCDAFPVQENLNETWIGSVNKWYIPLWNKVEYYHNAQQFFGEDKFSQLTEKDLNQSCTTYSEKYDGNSTRVIFSGFGNRNIEYQTYANPIRPGIYYWSAPNHKKNDTHEYVASSYITDSDGQNFVVTVCLWNDGRKGFTVSSPQIELDKKSMKRVTRHLRQIGFNSKHFVRYNYQLCF